MANNQDSEAFHEIPSSKCYYLGDKFGAVNKAFLKVFMPTVFLSGVVLTLVTEHTGFWGDLASAVWNILFLKLWYITLPSLGILTFYFYLKHKRSQKRKRENAEADRRRRKLDQIIDGK